MYENSLLSRDSFFQKFQKQVEDIALSRVQLLQPFERSRRIMGNNSPKVMYPETAPHSLLAITLEGCHQVHHIVNEQSLTAESHPGEALFFSQRPIQLNTNKFRRFVAAITFSHESTELFLIRHPGGTQSAAQLHTQSIAQKLNTIELHLLNSLHELNIDKDPHERAPLICQALIKGLIHDYQKQIHHPKTGKAEHTWKQIVAYIKENIHLCPNREELAHHFNLSPNYISTLCKRQCGLNFNDYYTRVRLREAKYLLTYGSLTISEISHKCGYGDPSYFSRVFKYYYHMSPGEFRLEVKSNE